MFTREPVVVVNALGVLVTAVLVFLVNSGVIQLTDEQQEQFKNLILLIVGIVVTFIGRSFVTPTADPRGSDGQPLS